MKPKFRRFANGELMLGDTPVAKAAKNPGFRISEKPELVHQKALESLRKEGGNVNCRTSVLAHYRVQFGAYQGQSFKWLVENALGYGAWLADNMRSETLHKGVPLSENKHAFREYIMAFPEGKEAVEMKANKRSTKVVSSTQPQAVRHMSSNPVQLTAAAIHKMYPAAEARQMVRALSQKTQPVLKPNIPKPKPATATSLSPKCSDSDDELLAGAIDAMDRKLEESKVTVSPKQRSPVLGSHSKAPAEEKSTGSNMAPLHKKSLVSPTPQSGSVRSRTVSAELKPVSCKPKSASTEPKPRSAGPTPVTVLPQPTSEDPSPPAVIPKPASAKSRPGPQVHGSIQLEAASTEVDIPSYWHQSFPDVDRRWVARAIFSASTQGNVVVNPDKANKLWFHPPQPHAKVTSKPKLEAYFGHRVFFWQPRRLWGVNFTCPGCSGDMKASGLYRTVREVMDIDSFYLLLGESYKCKVCGRNEISWNRALLDQLDPGHRSYFSIRMLYKTACDVRVIRLLRQRGLGNSASQLQKKIREQHAEEWANRHLRYYTDCQTFNRSIRRGLVEADLDLPPQMKPVPGYQWFQAVYAEDAMLRFDEVKAAITSTFGRVLKMDSTKKIAKKLAGKAFKTAAWCTNLSNEHGQVVQSVLTAAEGYLVDDMIHGVIKRYQDAEVDPPVLLYVDAHCCGSSPSTNAFTEAWPDLQVRLDVWHFMRRFNSAVTTDTHRLYATFMGQLSHAIFQWDKTDLLLLKKAKCCEFLREHVIDPSEEDVIRRINRKELALHCRRTTRGTEETTNMLHSLLTMFDSDQGRDTMGVPLLNHDRIWEQWRTNKMHVACIQDPPNIPLYTQTGTLKKGGVQLPVYRCARGSTSLECFHLHLNRFIPGTTASASHFQAYLLEGMMRWNQDRETAATSADTGASCYSGQIRHSANVLRMEVFGSKLYPDYKPPRKYTGELIGIDYLFKQTGQVIEPPRYDADGEQVEPPRVATAGGDEDLAETDEDEGFEDTLDPTVSLDTEFLPDRVQVPTPAPKPSTSATPPSTVTASDLVSQTPTSQTSAAPEFTAVRIKPVTGNSQAFERMLSHRPSQAENLTTPAKSSRQKPCSTSVAPQEVPRILPQQEVPRILAQQRVQPALAQQEVPQTLHTQEQTSGPDNIPGYDKVHALAKFLVDLLDKDTKVITGVEGTKIIELWNCLDTHDRSPTKYTALHRVEQTKGRFKNPKSFRADTIPGVHSVRRCALAPGLGPATRPDANRYMEAVILRLCHKFPTSTTKQGRRYARWTLVHSAYKEILDMVHNCRPVMEQTRIQLTHISQATLSTWYSDMEKKREREVLEQGLELRLLPKLAAEPLPLPLQKPATITTDVPEDQQHTFAVQSNTAGLCTKVRRKIIVTDEPAVTTKAPPVVVPIQPRPQVTFTSTVPAELLTHTPYSTKHYRKRKLEKEQAGEFKRTYTRTAAVTVCRKCGQDKTAGGHRQYYGNIFCPGTSAMTYEQWKCQFSGKYKKK